VRAIKKGPEPASLTRHRLTPHCNYHNYAEKDDLRHALTTEQRGLCCYCMGRIHSGRAVMKIEHWRSQVQYPDEQLNYKNLLGACLGGHGQPSDRQHCDTKKGHSALKWNPAEPADRIETRVRYELDGSIRSDDLAFDSQLEEVLNLNLSVLRNNRKSVFSAVLDWLKREKDRIHGPVSRERLERERDRYLTGSVNLLPSTKWRFGYWGRSSQGSRNEESMSPRCLYLACAANSPDAVWRTRCTRSDLADTVCRILA
jgi:uncharacterized protein (TIGR02646 family)